MTFQALTIVGAAVLAAAIGPTYAGPCLQEIDRLQPRVDAKLEAAAAGGPSAAESLAARLHRQPTPGSIAAAESKLGEIASGALAAAVARAREADRAGDRSACEQAVAEVQRLLGP
jgi:hypothetical protein